ncbi:hypothetical protein POL68_28160 [Stigmatella sp. ncwal1]|uniref:AZL_007920/MXAN_0976 family protein n=1 Tax=Stigmatella ashevillensis TaxID=2995309 RepID=A0ABT5DGW3_9BACT|nr:hypothetical protein [Stigmatella ashevillena]MDC0712370.1 hypothetical protein [Stigmatella ashevillena]
MAKMHVRSPLARPLLTTVCLGLSVAGCGDQAASPSEGGIEGQETTLAEIDVGYGTVRFQQLTAPDGSYVLGISEVASATLAQTPVDLLLGQDGLTALEAFKAIAPDRAVPEILSETHAAQAAALGRQDATVREAAFDRNPRTAMGVPVSICESHVYAAPGSLYYWTSLLGFTNVSGEYWLNVGTVIGDWSYATKSNVTMGVCNDSDVAISARYAYDNPLDPYPWIYASTLTIHPNDAIRYWNFSQASNYPCSAPAGCSAAATHYGVWGKSPIGKAIHLRTAVRKLSIISTPFPL